MTQAVSQFEDTVYAGTPIYRQYLQALVMRTTIRLCLMGPPSAAFIFYSKTEAFILDLNFYLHHSLRPSNEPLSSSSFSTARRRAPPPVDTESHEIHILHAKNPVTNALHAIQYCYSVVLKALGLGDVGDLAQATINALPRYDFVTANCQTFVLELISQLPRGLYFQEANPAFDEDVLRHLFNDIRKYLLAKSIATSQSVKDVLDKCIQRAKNAVCFLAGIAISRWKDIRAGFTWFFTLSPEDALTWTVEGLTNVVNRMRPLFRCVAGGAASGWNGLCSDLDLQMLLGIAAAVAALGVAWLLYNRMEDFWRWFRSHGRHIHWEIVGNEMQIPNLVRIGLPGIENGKVVGQRRHQPRRVEMR
ncbi:hypothetical protein LTR17_020633 [Elasticomyces elasticus]|nr:hypothetical protein LTR17_020633 [Elasticomyces elasticus]